MSTTTDRSVLPRAIQPTSPATVYGEKIDLVHGWDIGHMLRVRTLESGGNAALDWLFLKSSLSRPLRTTTGQLMVSRVLATRRGFQEFGYDQRQDMTWALLPAVITVGRPFEMYRNPPYPDYVVSAHFVLLGRIEQVESVGIDW